VRLSSQAGGLTLPGTDNRMAPTGFPRWLLALASTPFSMAVLLIVALGAASGIGGWDPRDDMQPRHVLLAGPMAAAAIAVPAGILTALAGALLRAPRTIWVRTAMFSASAAVDSR
jgi:hypothetical protein